jgi:nitroreductase
MDPIETILTRTTVPQLKMGPPGPDPDALRRILEAGAAAPDHGKLRPWRLLVVEGEGRERLGELFAAASIASGAPADGEEVRKQRQAPLRAPLIIVAVAQVAADAKIPAVEQLASTAAAAQNILLAAHALGFAGKWSTGKNAYDPVIREGLGCKPGDQILGFIYIGSYAAPQASSPRPSLEEVVRPWPG